MIALRHEIPLVITPHGHPTCFHKKWIMDALEEAAGHASQEHWSISAAITDAVTIYLQKEFEGTIIRISQLEQVIQKLLISLKHHDIANCFSLPDPPIYLSLVDLVQEAGTGYELAFFQLLRKRLQESTESNSLSLEIADLEPCLRLLKHRFRVGRHDILRDEIVNYVRCYGRSRFFSNKRKNHKPLKIELS